MVVSLAGISMSLLVCPLNSETKLSYSVRYILNKELKRDGGGGKNNDRTAKMESGREACDHKGGKGE